MTSHSHSKCHRRLLSNRKGYSGIIATIFLVLVVLFLIFNVYMFMNSRNTAYQDTVSQVAQMETDRNAEKVAISNVTYTNATVGVNMNCTITNTGPLSIQIVRLWLADLTLKEYGSVSMSPPVVLQPGSGTTRLFFVNITGALANDSFSLWFVTARGNMISGQTSLWGNTIIQVTNNTTAQSLSKVLGDFLPDYKSVQWTLVNHATGVITAPWNSGWILPKPKSPQSSNYWTVWRVNVTYYGNTTIAIDPHTCLSFVPLSATAREEDEPFLCYIVNYTGTRIGNFSAQGMQVNPSPNGTKLTLYLGAEDENNVGPAPMLPNVYYGDYRLASCIGMEDEDELTLGAYMNLVIYGKSPSTYAQTFPLFIILTRSYMISLSPASGNAGSTVTVTGVGFDATSRMTLAYDGVTLATSPTTITTDSSGGFTATLTVPYSTTGGHIVSATDAGYNVAIATFIVTPNLILNPTNGPKGTPVRASGAGFAANSRITIAFAGAVVSTFPATVTTNAYGSFGAAFIVPLSAAGGQTVTANDAGGNSATASFTVTVPSISLNPTSGYIGNTITVSGQNFVPSSAVAITYDATTVASTTANNSGQIPSGVTFTVPASVAGPHTVNAADATGNSATATFTVTPSIVLSPSSGSVGSSVSVSGSGFSGSKTVTITFAGSAIATTPTIVTTDAYGSFSATFIVPATTAGGKTVTVTDSSSNSATATFTITPAISLSPTSGNVGTTVTVSGTGFGATKTITIKYDTTTQTTSPTTVTTTSYGTFTCTFTVPASTSDGHTVTATDSSYPSNSASTKFTVIPAITISPTSGNVGTTVTVSGTGFAGSKSITATFNGVPVTLSGTTSTGSTGSFSGTTFTVPASTTGAKTVVITDASSNQGSATFTVNPAITLSPTSGNVGSSVTVTGSGFAASSTVTINYDGVVQTTSPATVTTSSSGAFSASFSVPASVVGAHTVSASDGSSSSSATFTVTQSITLAPTSGSVGSSVTVTGSGFAGSKTVTIKFGSTTMTTVPSTVTTDAYGSFSASFTVPAATAGGKTVTATDAGSNSASATFTVTPAITLSPTSGNVGTTVTVSGTGFTASSAITGKFAGSTVTLSGTTTTDSSGSFSAATFTVPASAAGGQVVTITDGSSKSATATFTVTSSITLSPTSGPVGTSVTVTGSGFAASATMTINYDGVAQGTTPTMVTTSATGAFSATFSVPASAKGSHTVQATDGTNSGSATFAVTSAISLNPTNGNVGTTITVSGTGFAASSTITVKYDGTVQTTSPATVATDAYGSFSASFAVPASVYGSHTVQATDGTNSATATFTVNPSIVLSPTSGNVGSTVTVSGTGFTGSKTITATFGGSSVTLSGTTTTDTTGSFSAATFTVPTQTAGAKTITITDASSRSGSATFTVVPAITLSPTSGPVGTTITVSGTGFDGSATVTIKYDGTTQTTVTSGSNGAFSKTFTAPASVAGSHTVQATEGSNSASATFTVTSAITLSPTSGNVGTSVTVSGTGFAGSSTIIITYEGTAQGTTPTTVTTGSTGSFSATFNAPASVKGSHTVRATDGTNSATATFTVSQSITLSPSSGSVGSSVSIYGSGFAASSTVTITFAGSAVTTSPVTVTTDGLGSFTASFTVPAGSTTGSIAGAKTVQANDGTNSATATFMVVPAITLNPTSGPTSTVVTVSGTGYDASKTITIKYDTTTQTTSPTTVTTTTYGTFTCTFTVPASVAGAHTVTATDSSSNTATTTFTLTPSITLSPTTGTVGLTVTVSGTGFGGSKTITATFDGTTVTLSGTTSTGSTGSFSGATFTVPASTAGAHTITITDSSSNTATTTFTVTPSISLNPTSGTVGTTVTVSGTGFAASSTIRVKYDGAAQATSPATVATDAYGSFSATFAVPASAYGSHTVQATDGTNSASATFNVLVSITITSSPAGSGFVIVDGNPITTPTTFNWTLGSTHSLQANSPVLDGTGVQYVYTGWSDGGAQTHNYVVPSLPQTVTTNYKTQYQLTMATNFGTTTPAVGATWYDVGSQTSISATAPSAGAGEQYVWNGWTGSGTGSYAGTSNPAMVTMNGPITETASWTHQWQVTFRQSGLSSDASGTVLTVGTNTYTFSQLPQTGIWVNDGTVYSYTSTVPAGTGKQYISTGVTGPTSPIHSSGTVTGNYKTQYQVTFDASSNVKGDSSATIVTVAGNAKTGSQLPYTDWFNAGSLTYSYASPITSSSSPATIGYLWSSTSGLSQTLQSNTFTVGGTGTITATYTTQTFGIDTNCEGFGSVASGRTIITSSMTAQANELIIVVITGNSNNPTVSSITDSFGTHLTYHQEVAYISSSAVQCLYVYYALTGTQTGSFTITVTMSSSYSYCVQAFGITGANTATPFDTNYNLPATARGTSSSYPTVTGVYTSNAYDMILAFEGQTSSTAQTASSPFTAPAALLHNVNNLGNNVEYEIVTSTQSSISVSFGTSVSPWIMAVDAVQRGW